jgi:very-short-patch-repair endonuclease
MTIIKLIEYSSTRKYKKRDITLKCDECHKIYDCESRYKIRAIKSELHFCSKDCSKQSFSSGKLKQKANKKLIEKYGSFYVQTREFKKQQKEQCLQQYGVESRLEAKEILEKIKQTCLEKYGKETFVGSDVHKSKLDYDAIAQKAWKTKIKNGTCSKSKIEERIAQILDSNNIKYERQVPKIKQWIDFYLISMDLYIQIDGVYWHGLNRPIEIIAEGNTSQDKKIYKQVLRDNKLNQYMKNNGLNLLRITDEQINKMSDDDVLNYIKEL